MKVQTLLLQSCILFKIVEMSTYSFSTLVHFLQCSHEIIWYNHAGTSIFYLVVIAIFNQNVILTMLLKI